MTQVAVHTKIVFNHIPKIAENLRPRAARVIQKAARDIEAGAKSRAPVDTGALRNSIQSSEVSQLHWRVTAQADYAMYVELGTVRAAAQPFMGPAVDAVAPGLGKAMAAAILGGS